jgi:hypothetical protein
MALILKDRVLESSTSSGTGSFTLTGAQTGYQSFTAIGNGNTTYYTIQGKNPDGTLTGEWEVGVGTWSTGNTLSRDTVLSNSLGTTDKIVFSDGDKDVFCDYPASKSVNQNADNKVLIPYTPGVTNVGSLNVGDATGHSDSGVIAAFTASEPLYLYTSLQNTSSANTSYASYAVNDGGHTSYGELGINNSNYSYTAAGYPNNTFSAPLATFVESYGGPLAIGTWDSQKISFIVNGSVNTADAMTINAAGTINIPSLTASQAVFTDASKNLVSVAVTGTGSVVLSASPTLTGTLTAATITASANATFNGVKVGKGAANISSNTAVGAGVLTNASTTGIGNVGVSFENTMNSLTTGTYNMGIGGSSLNLLTTGAFNVGMGVSAVESVTTGSNNVGVGAQSLRNVFAGNNSIGIGRNAGSLKTGNNLLYATSNSIYIGVDCLGVADAETNAIVIGQGAQGLGSNTTVIGKTATTITKVFGAIQSTTYTVATLPSASTVGVGARAFVTDALAPVFGSAVVTGGAVPVPVYSTGSAWNVG